MGKANGGNIQFEYLQLATTTADDDAIVYSVVMLIFHSNATARSEHGAFIRFLYSKHETALSFYNITHTNDEPTCMHLYAHTIKTCFTILLNLVLCVYVRLCDGCIPFRYTRVNKERTTVARALRATAFPRSVSAYTL